MRSALRPARQERPDDLLGRVEDAADVDAGRRCRGGRTSRRAPRSASCPRPAPSAHSEPSIWRAPDWNASTELATPSERFWCPWKPTCASLPISPRPVRRRGPWPREHQRAGRVDGVDALAPASTMIRRLPGELLGRGAVAIIRKPTVSMPSDACQPEVLDRDVGLGAVGGDPGHRRAGLAGVAQVVHRADAGDEQNGDPGRGGLLGAARIRTIVLDLGEAVVERRPADAVAVADLDDLDAGAVERVHGGPHLCLGELVRHGVAAVAQRGVGDPDGRTLGATPSAPAPPAKRDPVATQLADPGGRGGHDVEVARRTSAGSRRRRAPRGRPPPARCRPTARAGRRTAARRAACSPGTYCWTSATRALDRCGDRVLVGVCAESRRTPCRA